MTFQARWADGPEDRPTALPVVCIGCDQTDDQLEEFEIMLADGQVERVFYCADCAEAANTPQAPQIVRCTAVNPAGQG